jgi:tRNA (adenine57-N1/adenine58-N1)-methyltransferase
MNNFMEIKEGMPFLLYNSEKRKYLLFFCSGLSFGTDFGKIIFPEKIYYGQKIKTNKGYEFYILNPSLAELSLKVERKTTIIYPKDAGWLLLHSNIKNGSIVGEVGSGSGAFTFLLASIVGKEGKVYSFERRKEHLEKAKNNLEKLGFFPQIEWIERDPAKDGFGINNLETLFVDVPEPWELVSASKEAINPGGFWLSISPNINQVEKTVLALKDNSYKAIKTVEIIEREILVRENMSRPKEFGIMHTCYLTSGRLVNEQN